MSSAGATSGHAAAPGPIRKILIHLREPLEHPPVSPACGPPTEWAELVAAHDERDAIQSSERRCAGDRHPQPLSSAGRDPRMSGNRELARGLRRRQKNATAGGAVRFEKPPPDARARFSRDSRVAHQPEDHCGSAIDRALLYFGYKLPEHDRNCADIRSRDTSGDYCRIAVDFCRKQRLPVTEISNANAPIGNTQDNNGKYCFAKPGELCLVYLPQGGSTDLDLNTAKASFTLQWFNPCEGGALKVSFNAIAGGDEATLTAPDQNDWLAVIRLDERTHHPHLNHASHLFPHHRVAPARTAGHAGRSRTAQHPAHPRR